MGWNPLGKNQTSTLRKINKYSKNPDKVTAKKGVAGFYAFMFAISWIWSMVPDRDVSVWGCLGMLLFGFLIYRAIRYIFQQDPVQEAINDLEQQFWDRDISWKQDLRKDPEPTTETE